MLVWLLLVASTGCYAPLCSPGIPARTLPDTFRWPTRTAGEPLNYSSLALSPAPAYQLGPGDILDVTVPDLMQRGDAEPFQVQVFESGEIFLPRIGPIPVGGLTLPQAQYEINTVLASGFLQNPGASVTLAQKGTINVMVLGAVQSPGVHALPRYENDVAHALAASGGFSEDAGEVIEIHRQGPPVYPALPAQFSGSTPETNWNQPLPQTRVPTYPDPYGSTAPPSNYGLPARGQVLPQGPIPGPMPMPSALPPQSQMHPHDSYRGGHSHQVISPQSIIRGQSHEHSPFPQYPPTMSPTGGSGVNRGPIISISLRGNHYPVNEQDIVLHAGDVVVVPQRTDHVFYVVGPLSEQSRIRFSVGDRDREIGNGLLLPGDREIDVVTAVAMAGYIDPIDSPTTVTVHRCGPDGMPILVRVDLIAARTDPQETILVQPGDIIYLNPDQWWYTRRLIDRTIDRALGTAIGRWLTN